jgi:hypothetical protein
MDKDEEPTDLHPIERVRQGRQTPRWQALPEGDHCVIYTSEAGSTTLVFL